MSIKKLFISGYLLCCFSAVANHVNTNHNYPKVVLDNDIITMSIFLPDANEGYYRGTRFDWSGIIENVSYQGHTFYAPLHAKHNPNQHDSISGPAEEFGMYHPMGYDTAKPGETFVKLGVGLLEKNSVDDYQFNGTYKLVKAGDWQIKTTASNIEFSQQLTTENGWGYHYIKRISLVPNKAEFNVYHQLKNIGSKAIELDNYSHNFTIIDGTPYGPDYSVVLPFKTQEPTLINELALFKDNQISLAQPLKDKALWHVVLKDGGDATNNAAKITNNKTKAAIAFQGSADISHFIFWAVERAACPEPFIKIDLLANEQTSWQTTYTLSAEAAFSESMQK